MTCALLWYCSGRQGVFAVLSDRGPTGRRGAVGGRRRKMARCGECSLLRPVPDVAVGAKDAIPTVDAPNAALRLTISSSALHSVDSVAPLALARSVCKPEMPARSCHHAELSCCTSHRAPRPAFHPRLLPAPAVYRRVDKAAKVEPCADGWTARGQTAHSTYHPHLRCQTAHQSAPRARGLALWSIERETGDIVWSSW